MRAASGGLVCVLRRRCRSRRPMVGDVAALRTDDRSLVAVADDEPPVRQGAFEATLRTEEDRLPAGGRGTAGVCVHALPYGSEV